jgi:ribonuclease BN (tRNA processing enzyme)
MGGSPRVSTTGTEFEVWGCRGSRSLVPARSTIGNHTSCYSLRSGADLLVLDAGRGLVALGSAVLTGERFRSVRRVRVLVSHAHLDHWEGLKDAEWFWRKGRRLEITIAGSAQALRAIRTAYSHPSYVTLELLAAVTSSRVSFEELEAGEDRRAGAWRIRTHPLYHYSGDEHARDFLDTLGFHVTAPDGATVAYLCDHEPHSGSREVERALLTGAHLAVFDAHWLHARHHAHGHGSIEHAAAMAREFPETLLLAGHHGPTRGDAEIASAHRRYARGVPNFRLAVEGEAFRFARPRGFRRSHPARRS